MNAVCGPKQREVRGEKGVAKQKIQRERHRYTLEEGKRDLGLFPKCD